MGSDPDGWPRALGVGPELQPTASPLARALQPGVGTRRQQEVSSLRAESRCLALPWSPCPVSRGLLGVAVWPSLSAGPSASALALKLPTAPSHIVSQAMCGLWGPALHSALEWEGRGDPHPAGPGPRAFNPPERLWLFLSFDWSLWAPERFITHPCSPSSHFLSVTPAAHVSPAWPLTSPTVQPVGGSVPTSQMKRLSTGVGVGWRGQEWLCPSQALPDP